MVNQLIHACAGAGKTQYIITQCKTHPMKPTLIITLTTSGQDELNRRLCGNLPVGAPMETRGWYSFLQNHIIRPYLPLLFPHQIISGFQFDISDNRNKRKYPKKDSRRYFTTDDRLRRDTIEELAASMLQRFGGPSSLASLGSSTTS